MLNVKLAGDRRYPTRLPAPSPLRQGRVVK